MPRTRSQAASPGGLQALELQAPKKRIGKRAPGKSQPETVSSENNTSSSDSAAFADSPSPPKFSATAQTFQSLADGRSLSSLLNTSQLLPHVTVEWPPDPNPPDSSPPKVVYRDAAVQAVFPVKFKLNPPKPPNPLYIDASTQTEVLEEPITRCTSSDESMEFVDENLTLKTSAKRRRNESEDDTSEEPSAKRHQTMLTPSPAHHASRSVANRHRPTRPVQTPRTAPPARLRYKVTDSYSVLMGHLPKKEFQSMFPPTEEDWAIAQANKDGRELAEKEAAKAAEAESLRAAEHAAKQTEPVPDPAPSQTPHGSLFGSVRNGFGSISRSFSKVFKPVFPAAPSSPTDTPPQMEHTPAVESNTTTTPSDSARALEARKTRDRLAAELGRPAYQFPSTLVSRNPIPPRPLTQAEVEENLQKESKAIEARVHAETAAKAPKAPKAPKHNVTPKNKGYSGNIFADAPPLPPSPTPDYATQDETSVSKKRKRLPTGPNGEIPPPPGASYGIDDRYIDMDYDSEGSFDDDSSEEATPAAKKQKYDGVQTPRSVLKKRSEDGRNLNNTITRSAKRVTFDDSPVNTPTKLRARAGVYSGVHFADKPNEFSDESTLSASDVISPDTTLNTIANAGTQYLYPPPTDDPSFVPTSFHPRPGTFCLDYETYAEYDSEDEPMSGLQYSGSEIVLSETVTAGPAPQLSESITAPQAEPPATPRIAHAELPTTTTLTPATAPTLTDLDSEALNKARLTAEKHKPKNPSHLRQAERARTPSPTSDKENEFTRLEWPEPQTYEEAGIASQEIVDLVNQRWTAEDDDSAHYWMDREWPKFLKATREAEEKGLELEIDLS